MLGNYPRRFCQPGYEGAAGCEEGSRRAYPGGGSTQTRQRPVFSREHSDISHANASPSLDLILFHVDRSRCEGVSRMPDLLRLFQKAGDVRVLNIAL